MEITLSSTTKKLRYLEPFDKKNLTTLEAFKKPASTKSVKLLSQPIREWEILMAHL